MNWQTFRRSICLEINCVEIHKPVQLLCKSEVVIFSVLVTNNVKRDLPPGGKSQGSGLRQLECKVVWHLVVTFQLGHWLLAAYVAVVPHSSTGKCLTAVWNKWFPLNVKYMMKTDNILFSSVSIPAGNVCLITYDWVFSHHARQLSYLFTWSKKAVLCSLLLMCAKHWGYLHINWRLLGCHSDWLHSFWYLYSLCRWRLTLF